MSFYNFLIETELLPIFYFIKCLDRWLNGKMIALLKHAISVRGDYANIIVKYTTIISL
ncbi:hypothetical protein [Bacillus smithii]|uniref:hypothetical protein n=1 Tax=Bacillus smithii TaxID=1479 RepID=UPI003D1AA6BE